MYHQATAEKINPASRNVTPSLARSDLRKITLKLLQLNNLKDKQRLICVFDQKVLKLTEKSSSQTRSYMIDLSLLDEAPRRVYNINLKFLTAFLTLEVITYAVYVLKNHDDRLLQGVRPSPEYSYRYANDILKQHHEELFESV